MKPITLTPIGIIHSPYKSSKDMPIQGVFKPDVEAWLELDEKYVPGLKDLDGFSHAILIYYFHLTDEVHLQGRPYLEDEKHGIFAIRSPHRPNHLGFTIVKIQKIEKNRIYFTDVDVLDGTPLLDIKPYCPEFDHRENVKYGWIERHFAGEKIPDRTILKK